MGCRQWPQRPWQYHQDLRPSLTTLLRDLGFKELKAMPTGAVLANKKYPALEVLRTSKNIPLGEGSSTSYAFTVVVR